MSMGLIVPAVDHRPPPTAVDEPAASLVEPGRSGRREPPRSPAAPIAGGAAVRPASAPHRHHAAALIRQLGGRTEAALRRELDRFFAARPDLGHADRAAIARGMSRFRNQLLHHPRSTLRAAASAPDPAGAHPLLDAVRRLFGLADAPHSDPAQPRTPGDRPTNAPANSAA
jgi:glutamyl-tRNA reductase